MAGNENIFRNRFLSTVLFEPVDRAWRHECMGFWDETLTRWVDGDDFRQGLGSVKGRR